MPSLFATGDIFGVAGETKAFHVLCVHHTLCAGVSLKARIVICSSGGNAMRPCMQFRHMSLSLFYMLGLVSLRLYCELSTSMWPQAHAETAMHSEGIVRGAGPDVCACADAAGTAEHCQA